MQPQPSALNQLDRNAAAGGKAAGNWTRTGNARCHLCDHLACECAKPTRRGAAATKAALTTVALNTPYARAKDRKTAAEAAAEAEKARVAVTAQWFAEQARKAEEARVALLLQHDAVPESDLAA
jgi:hypothetical protein